MIVVRPLLFGMALAVSVALPQVASAQVGAFGGYYSSGMDQFNYILARNHFDSIERNAERRRAGKTSDSAPAAPKAATTIVASSGQPVAPERLAQHYPAEHRAQATKAFRDILDGYRQIETRFGIPRGDMAGAMAALIAGSWSICQQRDIVDAHFVQMAGQLREAIGQDPRFAQVGAADRQMSYEQFAILGTELALLHMALRQKPDPALQSRACAAGRGYLGQFGLDPDRLSITAQGLTVSG